MKERIAAVSWGPMEERKKIERREEDRARGSEVVLLWPARGV